MATGAQSKNQNMTSHRKQKVKDFLATQESHFEVRKERWSRIQEAEGLFLLTNCEAIRPVKAEDQIPGFESHFPHYKLCELGPLPNSPCFSFYIFQREISLNPLWRRLRALGELTLDEYPLLQIPGTSSILDFGFFQIVVCLHIQNDVFWLWNSSVNRKFTHASCIPYTHNTTTS